MESVLCHIHHLQTSFLKGVFDFRNTQMIITIKLTSLAWNIYDGYQIERISKSISDLVAKENTNPKQLRVLEQRRKLSVQKLPNLLEYLGYIYCFPTLMVGPAFEYNTYNEAITGEVFQGKRKSNVSLVYSSAWEAGRSFIIGLFFLVCFLLSGHKYPIAKLVDPAVVESTPFLQRVVLLYLAAYTIRFRFFYAWRVAEAATKLAGFGFEGYSAQGEIVGWNAVSNVDILGVELATSVQQIVRCWNIRTQSWLETYVYQRFGRSLIMTYLVSALWHGFYPGFYVFFLAIALLTNVERQARTKIHPVVTTQIIDRYFVPGTVGRTVATSVYGFSCWSFTFALFNACIPYFFLLSWERCVAYARAYYYIQPLTLVGLQVALSCVPAKWVKSGGGKAVVVPGERGGKEHVQ